MFHHFHPYKPFIKKDTKALIMGTLPPPRFCSKDFKANDVDFCYGSQDGLLWKCLDKIFDLNLIYNQSQEAVDMRKDFLIKKQLGICDIVDSCKREKVDASDIGMKEVKTRDILKYLKEYKTITTIIFTGGYCKNSPEYFLRRILKENKIQIKKIDENIPKKNSFIYDTRVITTISLTSPSNAANRSIGANEYYKKKKKEDKNYSTFDYRLEQYEKVFKSI